MQKLFSSIPPTALLVLHTLSVSFVMLSHFSITAHANNSTWKHNHLRYNCSFTWIQSIDGYQNKIHCSSWKIYLHFLLRQIKYVKKSSWSAFHIKHQCIWMSSSCLQGKIGLLHTHTQLGKQSNNRKIDQHTNVM